MFKYKNINQQLREERVKNEQLQAAQFKNEADIYYLSMMCDIDLSIDKEMIKNYELEF